MNTRHLRTSPLVVLFVAVIAADAFASTPPSGAITPVAGDYSLGVKGGTAWTGAPKPGVPSPPVSADTVAAKCLGATPPPQCDVYSLKFNAPANYWSAAPLSVTGDIDVILDIDGATPDGGAPTDTDIDLYIFDDAGKLVSSSGNPAGVSEEAHIARPTPGKTYSIVAYYYTTLALNGYKARSTFSLLGDAAPGTTNSSALVFSPATWADLQRTTAEPMINVDKRGNGRVYVDWPFSTTLSTSIIARSLDGGESFHTLYNPSCTNNSTVHCTGAGGGDSDLVLSPIGDTVYAADQEELFNFTTSTSPKAGDTWPNVNAASATTTVVDRMWMTASPFDENIAYLGYHQLGTGALNNVYYNVTTDGGKTWSVGATGKFFAAQTGNARIDLTGVNKGTIYHAYNEGSGGAGVAVSKDAAATFTTHHVAGDFGGIFPWISVDSAGNSYMIWISASGGDVMMSTSYATDPANVTAPGSRWSKPVRVSTAPAQTTALAAVRAGSPGKVAIIYYGTDEQGTSDTVSAAASWQIYVARADDALCTWTGTCGASGTPAFTQSVASERVVHSGIICTSGTTCTTGRNLADMIDLDYDADGRLILTWEDDQNDGQRAYVRVARERFGTSLLAGKPAFAEAAPGTPVADPLGDAIWPNHILTAPLGANLPGADITKVDVTDDGTTLAVAVTLADATKIANAITAVEPTGANRMLLVTRFERADHEWFVAWEYVPGAPATTRAFSGEILAKDGPEGGMYAGAIAYLAHDAAKATLVGNTVTISQSLSKLGSPPLALGSKLLSVVAATMIGPIESLETRAHLLTVADATRAFDVVVTGPLPIDAGIDAAVDTGVDAVVDSTMPDSTMPDSTLVDSVFADSTMPDSTTADSASVDSASIDSSGADAADAPDATSDGADATDGSTVDTSVADDSIEDSDATMDGADDTNDIDGGGDTSLAPVDSGSDDAGLDAVAEGGGCGCKITVREHDGAGLALLGVLGAWMRRRRRNRENILPR